MIKANEQNKSFIISGKNYSYIMYVDKGNTLQHVYFGKAVAESFIDDYIVNTGDKFITDYNHPSIAWLYNLIPSECTFFGRGDYHLPTAVIKRSDGSTMSRFYYVSHKIYNGSPEIKGMPHARYGGETLAITLKDEFSSVYLTLNYTCFDDSDVLVRNINYYNSGNEPVYLEKAQSFCLSLPAGNYNIMRLYGRPCAERTPEITKLGHGITEISSCLGSSSHEMNPFISIMDSDCQEEKGTCYGFKLIYSGSYKLTAELDFKDNVRIQGGINDNTFTWKLNGKECFDTPQAEICFSDCGLGNMSREYSDFCRNHIIEKSKVFAKRPVVINNWEATYFNFDNEKLYNIIDNSYNLGIDTFVLDDGWFGSRNSDCSGLGDWVVNGTKLVGGLKAVIDYAKERGMKFGLWIEPEMVNEDSDLYRHHPDFIAGRRDILQCRSRMQFALDFSRKDVVDYIYNKISKVLSENDISYIKWDMNRDLTDLYSDRLEPDTQGEFSHRYILGVYSLAERLTNSFPEIFFEGCASGGGRYDDGMLYYFPQIWTSDNTDGYERAKIQYGTSMCYPVSAMSCHVSACPNHQTGRTISLATRGNIASLGAFGYELDMSKVGDKEKQQIKEQIINYNRHSDLVLRGDLYRLSNPFISNYFAVLLINKDKTMGIIVAERYGRNDSHEKLIINGLDENKTYIIEELNLVASATELMKGISYPAMKDFDSFMWHIKSK